MGCKIEQDRVLVSCSVALYTSESNGLDNKALTGCRVGGVNGCQQLPSTLIHIRGSNSRERGVRWDDGTIHVEATCATRGAVCPCDGKNWRPRVNVKTKPRVFPTLRRARHDTAVIRSSRTSLMRVAASWKSQTT